MYIKSRKAKLEQNLKISQANPLTKLMGNMSQKKSDWPTIIQCQSQWETLVSWLLIHGSFYCSALLLIRFCPENVFLEEQRRERKGHHRGEERHWEQMKEEEETNLLTDSRMLIYILNYSVVHLKPI